MPVDTNPRSNPYEGTDLAPVWQNLRVMVRGTYDLQKLRIGIGNRIAANFRSKLGLKPADKEESDADADKILKQLRTSYKRLTDGLVSLPRENTFKGDEIISNYTELVLVAEYMELLAREETQFRRFVSFVKRFPIYEWLSNVKGCGPTMAGVIIAEIDITKARYPSSLWAYAGIDVASDGKGRSRRKEHLVEREYLDKDGKPDKRNSITFNPFLKTKLVGVLATCLIKTSGVYADIYRDYKHRLECSERHAEKTKAHRHNMAMRYMIKRFLADLYNEWRPLAGLPVAPDYHEAKLGHKHIA